MNGLEIFSVRTSRQKRLFLTFPWRIYVGDPLWVPPLLAERAKAIDPQRGPFFKRGQAEFFIARRGRKIVGTICAAEDRATNEVNRTRDCLFGFFECIEDFGVAETLLDQAARWSRERGLDTLMGPFNLDYEDSYGMLIEGRDRPPVMLCGHTPPYYQAFLERLGFTQARGDNLAYEIPVDDTTPVFRQLARLTESIRLKGWITIRTADLSRWEREVDIVLELLNRALAHLPDHRPWQRDALAAMLEPFRQIADPELVLFAQIEGKTVGWFPGVPNMNEVLIRLNGLRYPWDYLRMLCNLRRKPECLTIKSVLILPEYWGSGVALLLFDEMAKRTIAKGYKWADLSLTAEDNPYTPDLAKRFGARVYKRYRVYRLRLEG